MRTFKKGKRVVIVTPYGVIKGTVNHYDKETNKYTINTEILDGYECNVFFWNIKASHVYPPEDFGRATKFFKSRYGV